MRLKSNHRNASKRFSTRRTFMLALLLVAVVFILFRIQHPLVRRFLTENLFPTSAKHPYVKVLGLVYTVHGGTFNAYYSHLTAFLLATQLNIRTIHVPENVTAAPHHRSQPQPKPEPVDNLVDVAFAQQYFKDRFGMAVVRSQPTIPSTCILTFQPADCTRQRALPELWAAFLRSVPKTCRRGMYVLLQGGATGSLNYSSFSTIRDVAQGLAFSKHLVALGGQVSTQLARATSGAPYTGVHLRVEQDSTAWLRSAGPGKEYCRAINWALYHSAAFEAGLNATSMLYVASAMPLAALKKDKFGEAFFRRYSRTVYTRSDFLDGKGLPGQAPGGASVLEAVDFLALAGADVAMGFPYSRFSWLLAGYRALVLGKAPGSFHMVDAQGVLHDLAARSKQGRDDTQRLRCLCLVPTCT